MAIFENKNSFTALDDTEKLTCNIVNAQNISKHTEYSIKVQRGANKNNVWHVSRRYRDFALLHASLQGAEIPLPLPPKKLIGNMQPSFIADRQMRLQNYLTELLKWPILANSLPVKKFLDPSNYSLAFHENALQNVSMALRGNGTHELKGPLKNIGWRIRKHYYLVDGDNMLSWQTYGPDKYLSDQDLQQAFKTLQTTVHPFIDKIVDCHCLEAGAYTIRKVHPYGSVKDYLYACDYNNSHLVKYGNPKVRKHLAYGQLVHYGLQILQALRYLHEKGLPYGHLHPGNIVIENQKVLLLDIENGLLGVPSIYRPFILEHRLKYSMESLDFYCFGHTMYEMAFGRPLLTSTCDVYPDDIYENLESVLRLCLSSTACKHGMPYLEQLELHPFFSEGHSISVMLPNNVRPFCKFSNQLKDEMKHAAVNFETRLKEEQKLAQREKRQVRIQQILGSEEEMRKQRKKARKRDGIISRSHSSLNGGSTSGTMLRDERSNSVTSTLSSASLPISPPIVSENNVNSTSTSNTPSSPQADGRSALLSAICTFNKQSLNRVDSR